MECILVNSYKKASAKVVGCSLSAPSDGLKADGESEGGKRVLYVGTHSLGYRRDNMEVANILSKITFVIIIKL